MKPLPRTPHGSSLAEYATLVSLLATVTFVISLAFGSGSGGLYESNSASMERVQNRIVQNCLSRTRANDFVSAKQARPYNCFHLGDGNDEIHINTGENVVYPGIGRDQVFIEAGAGDTEVVFAGGRDIYHFGGGIGTIDLDEFEREQVRFGVSLATPGTAPDRISFDPSNRKPVDLVINTPDGDITVASHFDNQPVSVIYLEDTRLQIDEINRAAIDDQSTSDRDRIIGTDGFNHISPQGGNDNVNAGGGDDVIVYESGADRYLAGLGRDILSLETTKSNEISLSISRNRRDVVIAAPGGSITLINQADQPPSSAKEQFAYISLSDMTLSSSDILQRAVRDPVSSKSTHITGTRFAETILTDEITQIVDPGPGNDTIRYIGGTLEILNTGALSDTKTLDLTTFDPANITLSKSVEGAMIVETPKGIVEIQAQYIIEAETEGVPIDSFRLADRIISDATFRAEFSSQDQTIE